MGVQEIINVFEEVVTIPFSYLFSPNKRVYWIYLLSSAIIAFYVYKKTKIKSSFFAYVFNKKTWIGKSALIDYAFIFFNGIIKVLFLAPFVVYAFYIADGINCFFYDKYGALTFNWSVSEIVISYTVLIVVLNDFVTFIIHYLMHKIPFLWEFHKVHHSATELNPFTQYRIHPVELILNNFGEVLVKGSLTGIFLYLANNQVSIVTFLGVNILNFLFYFFGANLRHSHVKFKYTSFLEYFIISPYQHQIHHSNNPELYDTNMGSRFAIWDWMFGTLIVSKKVNKLSFGLGRTEDKLYNSFFKNLLNPFKRIFNK